MHIRNIFTLLLIIFLSGVQIANAQEVPPDVGSSQVLKASGAPFNVGWNYFTVTAKECTLKNVFNELQAAGGGALLAGKIWRKDNGGWKMFGIADSNNVKINPDNVFAFNSNQKFYLNIAPYACKTKNTNRDLQIEQVRDASTGQKEDSFLEKLLSVPGDFWSGVLGKMEVNKQENTLSSPKYSGETAVFNTLNVLGKTTLTDLGITGKITQGLLNINGLDSSFASINTLNNDLYLQNQLLGGINILNGRVTIDTTGNVKVKKLNVDESESSSSSIGGATLQSGTTSLEILTTSVTAKSRIFVTPTSETGGQALIVKTKTPGVGFKVIIEKPYSSDITFDWWIVN